MEEVLKKYEEQLYSKRSVTKADKVADGFLIQEAMKDMLEAEIVVKVGSEVMQVPTKDVLVAKTIGEAIENPDTRKMKDIMDMLGETTKKTEVTVRTVQDLFGDIAIENE